MNDSDIREDATLQAEPPWDRLGTTLDPLSDRRKSARNSHSLDDVFIQAGAQRQCRLLPPDVLTERRRALREGRFLDENDVECLGAFHISQRELGYRPLDIARFDVRLVELMHQEPDETDEDLLRCRLVQRSLIDPPEYIALSYNWGDTSSEVGLILNDTVIPIAVNLEVALRELRRRRERFVWVDFLSINQADDSERSFHLFRLSQIFSKANHVVAWLGPEGNNSDSAMNLLQQFDLSKRRILQLSQDANTSTGESATARRSSRSLYRTSTVFDGLQVNGVRVTQVSVFEALDDLLHRPYMQRTWIIQELACARSLEVLCGTQSASFDAVEEYITFLKATDNHHRVPEHVRALLYFRTCERASHAGEARMSLLESLVTSRLSSTTDPRDKVFAMLALSRDATDTVPMPSYSENVAKIFMTTIGNMMEIQGWVAAMLLAPRSSHRGLTLPTWTPNWNGLQDDAIPRWIMSAIMKKREVLATPPTTTGQLLAIRVIRLEQILSMSGQDQSLTLTDSAQLFTQTRLKDVFVTMWESLTAICNNDVSRSYADDNTTIFALKVFLEHSRSRRASEIGMLRVGSRRVRQWVDEYCESKSAGMTRQAIKSTSEYTLLKDAIQLMSEHKMKLAVLGSPDNLTFRLVYRRAHVGDWIFRTENCPLPIVLRHLGPPERMRFQLVGEVFIEDIHGDGHWTRGTGWDNENFRPQDWVEVGIV